MMLVFNIPITGKGRESKRWAKRQKAINQVNTYLVGTRSSSKDDDYIQRLNRLAWGK